MPTAVRIKTFTITKRGERQMQITLPRIWIEEHGLKEGDAVDLLKDTEDRLIIMPARKLQGAGRGEK